MQIGFDDFGKVRTNNLQFVDKTLFIKEVLDSKNIEVSVITRPRRFGKTFNLSTLHHFLAPEVNQIKTAGMFDGLKIATVDGCSYMQYQGKFPVIFVSFKEAKEKTFIATVNSMRTTILELFRNYSYLLISDNLSSKERGMFENYLGDDSRVVEYLKASLRFLCELLYKHFNCKPYLLIDEYDTPIQSGYLNGYYDEIVNLMRSMFGAALKTNPYFNRAVITGILRVAKESLFSGLNNVKVFSLLQKQYGQHFGFTEKEVSELLEQANLSNIREEVKKWYNGYKFGETTVYNPWSIVNYINDKVLKPYWVNTSDNQLIKKLLIKSNVEFKEQFKLLLQDRTIEKNIDENMVFGDLINNQQAAWSLLLMSGYLRVVSSEIDEKGKTICICAIPNWEVKVLYCDIIEEWLGNGYGVEWYQNFLVYLLNGDVKKFEESFGQVLMSTISVYDLAHNPEAFYQGFMLGLVAGIDQKQYEIKSNRESGLGRYDIAVIPKNISKPAIILEIKSVSIPRVAKKNLPRVLDSLFSLLVREAKKALEQINRNKYEVDLVQRGITDVVKIGIAFYGKEFRLMYEGGAGG